MNRWILSLLLTSFTFFGLGTVFGMAGDGGDHTKDEEPPPTCRGPFIDPSGTSCS